MNNKTVVKNLPNLPKLRSEMVGKRREVQRLHRRLERISDDLQYLESVSEVYEGVALQVWEFGRTTDVEAVGEDIKRGGNVYRLADGKRVHGGLWSGNIWKDRFGHQGETFLGFGWKTKTEILEAVKLWVAKGTIPKRKD